MRNRTEEIGMTPSPKSFLENMKFLGGKRKAEMKRDRAEAINRASQFAGGTPAKNRKPGKFVRRQLWRP